MGAMALSELGPHFVPLFVMRKAEEADGKYYDVGHVAAFENPRHHQARRNRAVKVTTVLRLAHQSIQSSIGI